MQRACSAEPQEACDVVPQDIVLSVLREPLPLEDRCRGVVITLELGAREIGAKEEMLAAMCIEIRSFGLKLRKKAESYGPSGAMGLNTSSSGKPIKSLTLNVWILRISLPNIVATS